MVSEANQKAIEAAGLSFILGVRIPASPTWLTGGGASIPGEEIPDGHVFTQPWPTGPSSKLRDQVICYQYKADRARRILRGIDEQVQPRRPSPVRPRSSGTGSFQLDGGTKSVNCELEAKARDLAGLKGYFTNLAVCPTGRP